MEYDRAGHVANHDYLRIVVRLSLSFRSAIVALQYVFESFWY